MEFLRHILRLCVVMLLSTLGASMALAAPMATSEITYFQTETTHFAQGADVNFAARAPPLAVTNVALTGGGTVIRGGTYTLHGQETVAALFGFDADHNATNNGVPNLTSSGTLTNRFPNDAVMLQSTRRTLVQDSSGRYWLEGPTGNRITPSGSYNFVTMPDGSVSVARPNTNQDFSTHLGLSDGGAINYAGSIRFGNNAGSSRGNHQLDKQLRSSHSARQFIRKRGFTERSIPRKMKVNHGQIAARGVPVYSVFNL